MGACKLSFYLIMTLNAGLRKKLGKRHGANLNVQLTIDSSPLKIDDDLMQCLKEEKSALEFFNKLNTLHKQKSTVNDEGIYKRFN